MSAVLAPLLLSGVLIAAGWLAGGWIVACQAAVSRRLLVGAMAALAVFSLLADTLAWLRLAWTRPLLAGSLALACALLGAFAVLAARRARSASIGRSETSDLRSPPSRSETPAVTPIGSWVATAVWVVLAAAGFTLVLVNPDYIAHWAYKGARFAIDQGIDYDFLRAPYRWHVQADYPLLVSSLIAVSAILGGGLSIGAQTWWSTLAVGGTLLASRHALRALGCSAAGREGGHALVALVLLSFAVPAVLPGSVDPFLALAAVAAVGPLLATSSDPSADREIAVIAAFAVASKVEGLAMAALLLTLRAVAAKRPLRSLASALPAVVLGGLHLAVVARERLAPAFRRLDFEFERIAALPAAIVAAFPDRAWHGFDLLLFALPLLMLWRPTRLPAALLFGMLCADLAAWALAPLEPGYYVASTLGRLELQVLPAAMVLLVAAVDRWSGAVASGVTAR